MIPFHERLALRIGGRNRTYKYQFFIRHFQPGATTRILDVGVENEDYGPYDNFLEKNYDHGEMITGLGIIRLNDFKKRFPKVKAVLYDGERFPFQDGTFDIVWSNAVLEHVGNDDKQAAFLREIRRCGRRWFITTPNRYFPIEVHTKLPLVHWLPRRYSDAIYKIAGKSWAGGDYMNLLSYRKLVNLLDQAGFRNFTIKKNFLGPFLMEFIVMN
jgi:SAM-dependent methyltransferase